MRHFSTIVCLFILSVTCLQCQEPCIPPADTYVRVGFLNFLNKKQFGDSVKFINIEGLGAVANLLPDTALASASFVFPLSPASDFVTFKMKYRKNNIDKLYKFTLSYTRKPKIINPDCGITIEYDALGAGAHDFDSVAVGKTIIDNDISKPHVVFYFKP